MTYIACWTLYNFVHYHYFYVILHIFHYCTENIEWIMKNFIFKLKNENEEKKWFVNLEYNYFTYAKIKKI